MFAEMCDSTWANRSRRGWTTLASFTAQVLTVGALLTLPLFYTEALPHLRLEGLDLIAPSPPPASAPSGRTRSAAELSSISSDHHLIEPPAIPPTTEQVEEKNAPPPVDLGNIGTAHGTGDARVSNAVLGGLGSGLNAVMPPPPPAVHRPPLSHMMEGNLIFRVQPEYPTLARQARIQGQVMLRAVISREGTIENLQVISGHPMLVQAAMKAVQQWRYRPYVLNDEPVEVETQVTVNFVLSGG